MKIYKGTKGYMSYALECLRCGAIHRSVVPVNMRIWLVSAKEFQRIHAKCEEAN